MLQGLNNVINTGLIGNPVNKKHIRQFGETLQRTFDMNLGWILPSTLLSEDIDAMIQEEHPLLLNSSRNQGNNVESESIMAEWSSHPVHLTSINGSKPLSTFIPFCAYQTNLLALGEYIDEHEFPVCSQFAPTVHKGQRCYTIDVSSLLPDFETKDR